MVNKGGRYMKIVKKLGVVIAGVIVSLKAWALKVYAASMDVLQTQAEYGVKIEPKSTAFMHVISMIIIPIALLLGIVIYCIKSKSSVLKKVILSIVAVLVYIIFIILVENLF